MIQDDIPVSEDTYTIFSYLSGIGLWLIIAVILIAVVLYKKLKK